MPKEVEDKTRGPVSYVPLIPTSGLKSRRSDVPGSTTSQYSILAAEWIHNPKVRRTLLKGLQHYRKGMPATLNDIPIQASDYNLNQATGSPSSDLSHPSPLTQDPSLGQDNQAAWFENLPQSLLSPLSFSQSLATVPSQDLPYVPLNSSLNDTQSGQHNVTSDDASSSPNVSSLHNVSSSYNLSADDASRDPWSSFHHLSPSSSIVHPTFSLQDPSSSSSHEPSLSSYAPSSSYEMSVPHHVSTPSATNNEQFSYDATNLVPFQLGDTYATPSGDGEGDEDALMTSPPPSSPYPSIGDLADTAPTAPEPSTEVEISDASREIYSLPFWLSGSGVLVPFTPITRGRLSVDPSQSTSSLVSTFSYLSQVEGPNFRVKEYLEHLLRSDAAHGEQYLNRMGGSKSILGNVLQKTRLRMAGSDLTFGDGWNKILNAADVIKKAELAMDVFLKLEILYYKKHPGEFIGKLGP